MMKAGKQVKQPRLSLAIFDLVLRLLSLAGTLGSAVGMGQAEEIPPFSTQFFRFDAQYDDFGEFQLFIIVNAIVCGYLALSLPVSDYHVVRRRVMLVFLDTVILALLTAGASVAAVMVCLAHN
ncbi:dehydrogenase [Lithospermum erythrorhizon]|uniref:CASP-like protein n=1 Tax=Lithospermum erythrorhizon TaxID=34254 RepID=A0AAV3R6Q6_LITER